MLKKISAILVGVFVTTLANSQTLEELARRNVAAKASAEGRAVVNRSEDAAAATPARPLPSPSATVEVGNRPLGVSAIYGVGQALSADVDFGGQTLRVSSGRAEYYGWTVEGITPTQVTMVRSGRGGGERVTLHMGVASRSVSTQGGTTTASGVQPLQPVFRR